MPLAEYSVENFNEGLITRIEEESLPPGSASSVLNWLSRGDRIELRRGYAILGNTLAGTGKITGLAVGRKFDGVEIPFRTRGKKLESYDVDNDTWDEDNTADILGTDADGEDTMFTEYHSLAGAIMFLSSPNSGIYKIMISDRKDAIDQSSTSHRGYIRAKKGRLFLWNRKDASGGFDKTGIYGSRIDKDELSDFTQITSENIGTGDASAKTFAATLAFKAAGVKRSCMYVQVTDTVESFIDDRNGAMVGDKGGTGTINYATGAISVTFNIAPGSSQAITSDYYWEDATSEGIVDFSKSTPRTAGQGFVIRQDDGGAEFMNLGSLGDVEFCLHLLKTWQLTLTSDDTNATNFIYRQRVGIPFFRAMRETGTGVVYVDAQDEEDAFIRVLTPSAEASDLVLPVSISDRLDLSVYRFNLAVVFEWNEFYLIACRTVDSAVNDRVLVYNKIWKIWDVLDYYVSEFASYGGTLIGGDPIQDNVWTMWSGFDDDDATILNHWISGRSDLEKPGLKQAKRMLVEGLIVPDQDIKVSVSYDGAAFVEAFTILGDGDYVDAGQSISIGASIIGSTEIGGGGDSSANRFQIEFRLTSPRFEYIQVKFEAQGIGFAAVSRYVIKDLRNKGRRSPQQYTEAL